MELNEYQDAIQPFRKYPNVGNNLLYPVLGLCGEAGEVANKVKKIQRDMNDVITPEIREALESELGDNLWYLAAVASELDLDLNTIARKNISKLEGRLARGTIQGSGDNR